MKRFIVGTFALILSATMFAAPRTVSQAQEAANKFLTADAQAVLKKAVKAPQLRLAYTQLEAEQPAFYVFNNDNGGFVLVSADDNANEILGYSTTGSFNPESMPENMKVWFKHYAEEIAWAAQNPTVKRSNSKAVKRSITPVAPLLKTKWNQDAPFYDLCPDDAYDDTRCYTGCVATATAQIMKYWEHPTQGTGTHKYTWENCTQYNSKMTKCYASTPHELSADFGSTTYDWANMKDSYKGYYNATQGQAVATLMYHIGVACDMQYGGYGAGGSGAYTSSAAQALYTYFGYDKSLRYILKDNIGQAQFEELFLKELQAKRPILMGGATTDGYGHEFVCDGVDKDGFFHINWGWGGTSDEYFSLSALDPDEQGAGGAASGKGYSVQVEAVIGIKPDAGGDYAAPLVDIEPGDEGNFNYTFSKTATEKTTNISFYTNYAYNNGPIDVNNAPIVYAVYQKDSTFVQAFGSDKFTMEAGGANYRSLSLSGSFDDLPAGDYWMAIAFRMSDTQDWTPIAFAGVGEFMPLHATADSVYIGDPQKEGSGGGGEGDLVKLDVAYADAIQMESYGSTFWVFNLYKDYNSETKQVTYPDAFFFVYQKKANYIAGTYTESEIPLGYVALAKGDTIDVESVIDDLKVKCLKSGKTYNFTFKFTANDSKTYYVDADLDVTAYDYESKTIITLKDKGNEEAIESVTIDSEKAIKLLQNGNIIIKVGDKTYNIIGKQIK